MDVVRLLERLPVGVLAGQPLVVAGSGNDRPALGERAPPRRRGGHPCRPGRCAATAWSSLSWSSGRCPVSTTPAPDPTAPRAPPARPRRPSERAPRRRRPLWSAPRSTTAPTPCRHRPQWPGRARAGPPGSPPTHTGHTSRSVLPRRHHPEAVSASTYAHPDTVAVVGHQPGAFEPPGPAPLPAPAR